ncbi:MAG: hypothetical protein LBG13_01460 [Holosporales bacterium]|jgi:hypothetical protein|nr:hypothetical protein [Holosporales bacterium]
MPFLGKITGSTSQFFQIFVNEKEVVLRKISDNRIDFCSTHSLNEINGLYEYIDKESKIPINVIVHNNDFSTRNLLLCDMKNSDIRSGLRNNINYNGTEYNTSFYIRKGMSITVCDTSISPQSADFINWVFLESREAPVSISCWPLWVVDNYFAAFPCDAKQFEYSLLITKSEKLSEIIVVNNHLNVVCYRCFYSANFKENNEISATTKYIAGLYKIDHNDIAIYSMDESSIETFVNQSGVHMSFVSKVMEDYSTTLEKYKRSLRIALRAMCCAVIGFASWRCLEISLIRNEIAAMIEKKQAFPEYVLAEKDNLREIDENTIENIDFAKIIENILINTENTLASEIELCMEAKLLNISIRLFNNNIRAPYSKKIKIANYNFDVFVSDSEIVCNGKRC